jgi:AraC-like DNA-binding protein
MTLAKHHHYKYQSPTSILSTILCGRQFITRKHAHSDIFSPQLKKVLRDYFCNQMINKGLPTVTFLAEKVFLSPGYLSDLLKKEIGMNAQDFIHYHHIIEEAKQSLRNSTMSIAELSHALGFEYPQYSVNSSRKKPVFHL